MLAISLIVTFAALVVGTATTYKSADFPDKATSNTTQITSTTVEKDTTDGSVGAAAGAQNENESTDGPGRGQIVNTSAPADGDDESASKNAKKTVSVPQIVNGSDSDKSVDSAVQSIEDAGLVARIVGTDGQELTTWPKDAAVIDQEPSSSDRVPEGSIVTLTTNWSRAKQVELERAAEEERAEQIRAAAEKREAEEKAAAEKRADAELVTKASGRVGQYALEAGAAMEAEGYDVTYILDNPAGVTDGEDWTDNVLYDSPEGYVVTDVGSVSSTNRTVTYKVMGQEMFAAKQMKEELEAKLSEGMAIQAVKYYGKDVYPYGFNLHSIMGVISTEVVDADTWHLIIYCDITNEFNATAKDQICEALVTGSNSDPRVVAFSVYPR